MKSSIKTGPESSDVLKVVELLKKNAKEKNVWKKVASVLLSSRRRRPAVNISKIELYAKENETVVVPGKVLGTGKMSKPVAIAAILFSASARKEIKRAGGKCLSIPELVSSNPKGSGVRVMR